MNLIAALCSKYSANNFPSSEKTEFSCNDKID